MAAMPTSRFIYEYESLRGEPIIKSAKNINHYLVDAPNVAIVRRTKSLSHAPEMDFGSKAVDFGHLTLSPEEKDEIVAVHPASVKWIRPYFGSAEFINGRERFCLWLKGISPEELRRYSKLLERVERVRESRRESIDANTRNWATRPTLFQADRQPETKYLLVPKVSSERRSYIPLGFMDPFYITNPSVLVIPNATMFHFGILQSRMHMAWTRTVCGRLKSDYQYSTGIVYNNFPWPEGVTDAQRQQIETLAQAVLDARALYPESTLADLYDPLTMPPELAKAHHALDRAVDKLYQRAAFATDADRVALLFKRYQALTA